MIGSAMLLAAVTVQGGFGAGQWAQLALPSEAAKRPPDYRPFAYGRVEWVPSDVPLRFDFSLTTYSRVKPATAPAYVTLEGVFSAGVDFGPYPWRHGPRIALGLLDPAVAAPPSRLGALIGMAYRLGIPLGGGWLHVDPEVNVSGQDQSYRDFRLRIGYEWRVL